MASVQRLDRGHLSEVGGVAAVAAGEASRIELGLDAGDGDAQRVVMAADAQVDVVACGLQPFDVRRRHQELAVEFAPQDTLGALHRLQRLAHISPLEPAGLAPVAATVDAVILAASDTTCLATHTLAGIARQAK